MNKAVEELSDKEDLGKKGEQIAREFLAGKGYQILDSNWHFGHKEIDIVA